MIRSASAAALGPCRAGLGPLEATGGKRCREFAWSGCWGQLLRSVIPGNSEVTSLFTTLPAFDVTFLPEA